MKAVIVDLNGNDAVALCDNGRFIKLKNESYQIGQQITMKPQTIRFPKQAAIAASAALVILAGSGLGRYTWNTPISYVSLDVNPSIAYSLNEFNRVIAVSGMNDEGAAIVDAVGSSLQNVDITTALTITVEQLSTDAYLDMENTNYMVIGVYSDKNSKADALMTTVDAFCTDTIETCSVTTVSVSRETMESADSYGITAGKMELINEIASVANDPATVDPSVLADLTVAELEQTKEAAASGTSVPDAVAAASAAPEPDKNTDPAAVASDDKPADPPADNKKPDESSSDKKDQPSNEPVPVTDGAVSDSSPSVSEDNSSSANNPASVDNTTSTDKTGFGSSDKKDEGAFSDNQDEPVSSDTKDEDTSSSDKEDDAVSSDKKDDASEDSSGQTNSNLDHAPDTAPEIVTEIKPDMLADPPSGAPEASESEMSEQSITCNMLS